MSVGDDKPDEPRFAAALARRGPFSADARSGSGDPPPGTKGRPPRRASPWGAPPGFAAPSAEAVAAVKDIYADVEAALGPSAGACQACGRCCRFRAGGLVLFASSLEMVVLLAEVGPPDVSRFIVGGPVDGNWICPYQEGNRCAARDARPLGCRTYFCDEEAGRRGRALHADALGRLRTVAKEQAYPWWYGPAKAYLDAAVPPHPAEGETA